MIFKEYLPFKIVPLVQEFLIAVLLTPNSLAARVILEYIFSMFVSVSFTITDTPILDITNSDILFRVDSDNLIPVRTSDNFFFSNSVKTLFDAAKDSFFLVSSLILRTFLKKSNVFLLCLNPNEEPATFKTL